MPEDLERKRLRFQRYLAEHREERKAYCREWRLKHLAQQADYFREYGREHSDEINTRRRVRYVKDPGSRTRRLVINAAYRAATRGRFSVEDWETLQLRQKRRCYWCKRTFTKARQPTIDHVISVSKGGKHDLSNIVAACLTCNISKGNKLITFF